MKKEPGREQVDRTSVDFRSTRMVRSPLAAMGWKACAAQHG
jgi:hypothetical protein